MFFAKHAVLAVAICLGIVMISSPSYGIYFTIQLKNGNEIITDHYTDDNASSISFYTNEGAVKIPKATIKSIKSNDGSVAVEMDEADQKRLLAPPEDEGEQPAAPAAETDKDRASSIQDQLSVINANIENLTRNKNLFTSQLEQFQQQKVKSEQRLENMRKNPDMGTKADMELEQTKIKDTDAKIEDMQQRIKNNDQMFEAQQRIKKRFEEDLAKVKKQ